METFTYGFGLAGRRVTGDLTILLSHPGTEKGSKGLIVH